MLACGMSAADWFAVAFVGGIGLACIFVFLADL